MALLFCKTDPYRESQCDKGLSRFSRKGVPKRCLLQESLLALWGRLPQFVIAPCIAHVFTVQGASWLGVLYTHMNTRESECAHEYTHTHTHTHTHTRTHTHTHTRTHTHCLEKSNPPIRVCSSHQKRTPRVCQGETSNVCIPGIPTISFQLITLKARMHRILGMNTFWFQKTLRSKRVRHTPRELPIFWMTTTGHVFQKKSSSKRVRLYIQRQPSGTLNIKLRLKSFLCFFLSLLNGEYPTWSLD